MLAATLGIAAASKIIDQLTAPTNPSTGYAEAQADAARPKPQGQAHHHHAHTGLQSQLLQAQEAAQQTAQAK